MHQRLLAMASVLVLGVATVMWVSANPQEKASVKPAAVKSSGSCCPSEKGATKATVAAATEKNAVKPVAAKEGKGECPYAAASKAAANGKEDCSNCPEKKSNATTVAAKEAVKSDCGGCPFMKSTNKATEAKAKPVPAKPANNLKATQAKATNGKAAKSL
jgi:hypothetical protein